ncbi:uncharacterized protein LOC100882349 isoform X1 [Megachile rotundata]|uniref:uncharacterized protein LOC100882349 isoform X1 n=1 Tax=Megachile rotundata TaxID=143995 RepID=UPI0006150AE1|nr:PREDICTED: uncharacterized protein LOC100882349 isoform X1 [Megachile rotundata]XP_012152534.1 PREDICTED: uncharacterized protein LOC100882349 isoform X1 [Megachile rotundata]
MTTISRGRGWMQNDENPLPRPGRSFCSEDVNHTNIINLINTVNDENLIEKAEAIVKLVNDKTNEQNLENIHRKLYKHALNDKEFGSKLLKVYTCTVFKSVYDSEKRSFYGHLVECFQIDYESMRRRKELRDENVMQFYNAISLFSEFLRCITGPHFSRIVQSALLNYMEMLIETSSAEDIKIFAEQVIIHGKHLYSSCKEETDNLMIAVRQKLINDNMSVTSRRILLYVIDLSSRNFDVLPDSLQKFYKSQLENDFKQDDKHIIIKSLTKAKDGNRE